jgi:phosphatidate cytidylyltransferase
LNNVFSRILLVVVAIPALVAVALLLPQFNHAALALIIIGFSVGAARELANMLIKIHASRWQYGLILASVAVSGVLVHLAGLYTTFSALELLALACLTICAFFGLALLPFTFPKNTDELPQRFATTQLLMFIMGYIGIPGSLLLIFLTTKAPAGFLVLWFCMIVFANDSLAWLIGVTIGRRRGFIKVSPNKSLEGFIAGLVGSIAGSLIGNQLFGFTKGQVPVLIILGLLCGLAGIIGDLFESAIKRTAGVKDSGNSIPGRGGILDSYDNILFAAFPFFVALLYLGLL